MLDRAFAHVAAYAHALIECRAVQRRNFRERVIVRLALGEADVRQRQQRDNNNSRTYQKFCRSFHKWPRATLLALKNNSITMEQRGLGVRESLRADGATALLLL